MELSDEFILSSDEMVDSLFTDSEEDLQETPPDQKENSNKDNEKTTEESQVNPDDLFDDSESVGSGKDIQEKEENTTSNKGGTSPKTNFYSSIASALKDEGILPDLDDDVVNNIKEASDFANAIEKQIQARFDERQKRIDDALNANVEPDEVRQYEQTLSYLDSIKDENITEESDNGENLRKKLIYQDFINRGYSKERALREVKKSFDSGTDIEDAKEALSSNKDFFNKEYQSIIKEAQREVEAQQQKYKEEAAQLKKSMLDDKEIFEGITLDKSTRQKAFDNITKPIYKTEDGTYLTAIQKYQIDNPVEFRKYLSVLFTMTDGFKSLDKVIKGKVNKEVKQSLRELEHKLSNSSRSSNGNPRFIGIGQDDSEQTYRGWQLDV